MDFNDSNNWAILSSLEQSIKAKVEQHGKRLRDWNINIYRGILTGFNEAFIVSGEKKNALIAEDPRSAEIIRPILRGRDIKRYGVAFADLWLINVHNGVKDSGTPRIRVEEYPAIKTHLDTYFAKLAKRADKGDTPYNLRNCAYMDDFSKQKIVWGNLCLSAQYAMAEPDMYINAPSPMIVPGEWYMLAILNSKLADWYIRGLGVTRNGGYFEYKPMFVDKLPVPKLPPEQQAVLNALAKEVQTKRTAGIPTADIEAQINRIVYSIYGLSAEEVAYIESKS